MARLISADPGGPGATRPHYRRLVIGCLAALLAVASCAQPIADGPAPSLAAHLSAVSEDAVPASAVETVRDLRRHDFGRRRLVKSGTGFFVSSNGLLLTSAHLVAGCAAISVWPRSKPAEGARVLATDRRRDLALLATGVSSMQFAAAPAHWRPRAGEKVSVLGFGIDAERPLEPVLMRGGFRGRAVPAPGRPAFIIQARIRPGTSGGLVVDQGGSLVGMVVGYYADRPDLAVVVANVDIDRFLTAHGVRLGRAPRPARGDVAIDRFLLGVSVLVQCIPEEERIATARSSRLRR